MADGRSSSDLDSDLRKPGDGIFLDQCVFGNCASTKAFDLFLKGHLAVKHTVHINHIWIEPLTALRSARKEITMLYTIINCTNMRYKRAVTTRCTTLTLLFPAILLTFVSAP